LGVSARRESSLSSIAQSFWSITCGGGQVGTFVGPNEIDDAYDGVPEAFDFLIGCPSQKVVADHRRSHATDHIVATLTLRANLLLGSLLEHHAGRDAR
jgi:hypothetical protein